MSADPIPALKEQLRAELVRILDGHPEHWAAARIGTQGQRVLDLRGGRLERFSLEQLIRFLTRARYEVSVSVAKPAPTRPEGWEEAARPS